MTAVSTSRWQFWIDRGGTFTDIVAQRPDSTLVVHKLLSENPERYLDAPIQGIREVMGLTPDEPIPSDRIAVVKMGTTVATNALLERKGDRTLLIITQGFRDALRIAYQNRPNIFARQIILPEMLYERVVEVEERYSAQGEELNPIRNEKQLLTSLQSAYDDGIRSCAIVLMHGYRYPNHENQVAALAREVGFTQISVSNQVSPLMKLVSRGDTTVVDAYLSPILRRYVDRVAEQLGQNQPEDNRRETLGAEFLSAIARRPSPKLMFMQSNGGLTDAQFFQGKDSILSGPAGGIVGAVQTSKIAGFQQIIGFDMGGTSTDVSHYNSHYNANHSGDAAQGMEGIAEYERTFETEVAGVRLRAPMMAIHTVAAGGGSILEFDGARYRVGPESAGANPGPACYRKGGPLTVTDANIMVGKLHPEFFPKVFGSQGDLPLDVKVVQQKFAALTAQIQSTTGDARSPEQVAQGFLAIAVEKMASAIKKISVQRGYDVTEYTLCCFGGAGGQHACAIADALGMSQVFIHPYAGVLSAYGMGLADIRIMREQAVEAKLTDETVSELTWIFRNLVVEGKEELARQAVEGSQERGEDESLMTLSRVHLRYEGTDSPLMVNFGDCQEMREQFEQAYQRRYGFIVENKTLIVEAASVELIKNTGVPEESKVEARPGLSPTPVATVQVYTAGAWRETLVFQREDLQSGDRISGPALIIEATGTNVIEPNWQAEVTERNHLVLKRRDHSGEATNKRQEMISQHEPHPKPLTHASPPDPVLLEIFNNLFQAIAEQMGVTLQNTSYSVNIKERLDFSCAIFDQHGQLVANAPHIPVHLGSMSESVQSLITACGHTLQPGDVYALNNPYNGGTHLPDITVITPVFATQVSAARDQQPDSQLSTPLFFLASRGHHADIGGITPGSMPPSSTTVEQEGVLIDNFQLVSQGHFREAEVLELLTSGKYPVRNPTQNLADLQAQIAANERGVQELINMVEHSGLPTVQAYMGYVQDNAEVSVRRVISNLCRTSSQHLTHIYPMDDGCQIQVTITLDCNTRSAKIDFTGTSPQQSTNFNAPVAVCKAAVLYVFRTLVDDNIPLNAGCLRPLEIVIPEGCMLNPRYPAAVVAGNVETSQVVTDALYGALGVMAASQGTMNNFTFGSDRHQYYETICGGSGAGPDFNGADAVHTHMTNSRLTDPEVLEWRFPILLKSFSIRANSGGKGLHQGGNGIIRRIQFREPMTAAILSNHRVVPPYGLQGGESGATGRNYIERGDGTVEELDSTATVEMEPGDVFVIETPGGGGYGLS